jgi:hypothetical protein
MNTKSILNPVSQIKKAQMDNFRTILSITLISVVLLLTIAALSSTTSLPEIAAIRSPIERSLAANPELMITRRSGTSGQSFLAANPEINMARRFAAVTLNSREWVVNPELSYVRSHAEGQLQSAKITFPSTNPELMSVHRYATKLDAGELKNVEAVYATNPELKLVHRYEASQVEK